MSGSAAAHRLTGQEAIADAARAALFETVGDARRAYDAVRGQHERDAAAPAAASATSRAPRPTIVHEAALLLALLAGIIAFALVVPSPRTGRAAVSLDDGVIWSGALAILTVAIYAWTERVRPATRMYRMRGAATALLLFFPVLWAALIVIVALQWSDVDGPLVGVGIALIVVAVAGSLVLWWRARRREGALRPSKPLTDDQRARLASIMDEWWHGVDAGLTPAERASVAAAYERRLDALRAAGAIGDGEAERAARAGAASMWREARS